MAEVESADDNIREDDDSDRVAVGERCDLHAQSVLACALKADGKFALTVPNPPITMNATSIMQVVMSRFGRRGTLLPSTTETDTATTCSTLVISEIVNLWPC